MCNDDVFDVRFPMAIFHVFRIADLFVGQFVFVRTHHLPNTIRRLGAPNSNKMKLSFSNLRNKKSKKKNEKTRRKLIWPNVVVNRVDTCWSITSLSVSWTSWSRLACYSILYIDVVYTYCFFFCLVLDWYFHGEQRLIIAIEIINSAVQWLWMRRSTRPKNDKYMYEIWFSFFFCIKWWWA